MSGLILPYRGVRPRIAADAFIAPTATVIGDVEIGPGAGIWFGVTVRGDVNHVRIGARTNVQDGTVIHVASGARPFPTLIGADVTIGHLAMVHACTLEDGAFVGMKACVMDGAVVEAGAMVAAGALVAGGKRVPAGQLWAGAPARFVRKLGEDEAAEMAWVVPHYADLAQEYRRDLAQQEARQARARRGTRV